MLTHSARAYTHTHFQSSAITHRYAVVIIVSFLGDTRSLNISRTGRESHNWPWSICSPVCVLTLTSDFNELVLQWLELLAMRRSDRGRATRTTQRRPSWGVCVWGGGYGQSVTGLIKPLQFSASLDNTLSALSLHLAISFWQRVLLSFSLSAHAHTHTHTRRYSSISSLP